MYLPTNDCVYICCTHTYRPHITHTHTHTHMHARTRTHTHALALTDRQTDRQTDILFKLSYKGPMKLVTEIFHSFSVVPQNNWGRIVR